MTWKTIFKYLMAICENSLLHSLRNLFYCWKESVRVVGFESMQKPMITWRKNSSRIKCLNALNVVWVQLLLPQNFLHSPITNIENIRNFSSRTTWIFIYYVQHISLLSLAILVLHFFWMCLFHEYIDEYLESFSISKSIYKMEFLRSIFICGTVVQRMNIM